MLLTVDPARRAERTLVAAQATMQAGAFGTALELLATAEAGPLDELRSARVDPLRGEITFASGLGSDAPPLLLKAANRIEPLDLNLAVSAFSGTGICAADELRWGWLAQATASAPPCGAFRSASPG